MTSPQAKKAAAVTAPEAPELLSVLVTQKVLSAEQAEKVRRAQKVNGFSAEQAMIQLGIVSDAQIAQALAAHAGLPYVKINPLDLDLDVVTKAIAGPFARRHGMVAIAKNGNRITIAVHNPFAPFPFEDVKRVTGCEVDRVVATRNDVEAVNKGFYDLKSSLTHAEKQLSESRIATVDLGNQEFLSKEQTDLDPAAAPVVKALDHILGYAFEQRASDIHFEPKRELTLVRLRIDGILHDVHLIPKIVYGAVMSRIKLLSGCNLAEKRRPQDGRIKREQGGREIELRVSTMPTAFGEKAVLRIFDPDILLKGVDELGLSGHDVPKFHDFIARPTGIILVTGPTGSGKTTTLYAALEEINTPERKIITVEDPVEYRLPRINQVQVQEKINLSFGRILRSALRQDPDVILVGEMRDLETVEVGLRAAMTGHMVLSTLHTNDAIGTPIRLQDMGAPRYMVAMSLHLVLAQRLLRLICESCSQEHKLLPSEREWLRHELGDTVDAHKYLKGLGCSQCNTTGYLGRTGVYEMLEMTRPVVEAASSNDPSLFIQAARKQMHGHTLRRHAATLATEGRTSVDEAMKVSSQLED
jgi:MSHA biogenesis protein MshE